MAYDEKVADRVRWALGGRRNLVERKMMGGLCFMAGGNMCCCVTGSALMVRVGREGYEKALALAHVRPLEFGGRRPSGFVLVDPEGYRTAGMLKTWIEQGLDVAARLPKKTPKKTAPKSTSKKSPRKVAR